MKLARRPLSDRGALRPEVVDFDQADASAVVQSREQRGGKTRRPRRRDAQARDLNQRIYKSLAILLAICVAISYPEGLFWGEQNDWAPRAIGSGAQFAFCASWLADCLD